MGKPDQRPESLTVKLVDDPTLACREDRRHQVEQRRFGVAFRDLGCYGFIAAASYQATFASFIFLIWEAVQVVLGKRRPQKVTILRNFDGLVLPGEMLLVLGKPGSGCTTFLRTLAGDTHGFHIETTAKVYYQCKSEEPHWWLPLHESNPSSPAIPFAEMHRGMKGECIYLSEHDVHFPELTLGETLAFAASSRESGANQEGDSQISSQKVASMFRLDNVLNTRVGNAMIRGLSGGEKRRTSLAEAFIGNAQLQCWDNSTRGLDSSTALQFVQLLREATRSSQTVVAMSIYQASEAMYENFDKVTLLYEGRQIYFGSVNEAVRYFQDLGFVKPSRATSPDFLTSLTNAEERIIREGFEDCVPRSPDEFAGAWRQSLEARRLFNEIGEFNSDPARSSHHEQSGRGARYREEPHGQPVYPAVSERIQSIHRQISICIHRGLLRLRQNLDPIFSTIFGHAVLGLVIGSIFYNLDESSESLDKRSIAIFFALVNSAFSPAFEVLTMWAQRPIVEKHHRYAFYHPFTEAIASMICDLPNKILISILFHLPVYFLTNLRRSASAFFTYWILMFATILAMSSVFRTIGSLSRTIEQTSAPSAILIVLAIIYTGFVIPPRYMVPWLSWFRWVNPLAYAYESLMINEFHGRDFPCASYVPSGPSYPKSGMVGTVCAAVGATPGRNDIQGSEYLSLKYGYFESHLWRNLAIIFAFMIVFCMVHLLSTEFNPSQRSKGDVLVFPRKYSVIQHEQLKDVEKSDQPIFSHDTSVKKSKIRHVGHEGANPEPSMTKLTQSQGAVIHWNKLGYKVKTHDSKPHILSDIHGWVKPGTLTALMGVSGAGKTTLLDVLSNRTTSGTVSGDIYVNGNQRDPGFSRRIGYVQQDDIHLPTATVREALEFSAILRQTKFMSAKERAGHIDNILRLLDMERCANAIVGVQGQGLNVEQRRRLTIAVEMAAGSELLLFLDEPTSGLDSQTAWSICKLLRKLANHGQTVLCTIHQPSSELFQMFDSLLLLDRGGTELYFGPIGSDASILIDYFETQGAPTCPPGDNPAEWAIQVTSDSTSMEEKGGETWSQKWNASMQRRDVLQHLKTLTEENNYSPAPNAHGAEYIAPMTVQLGVITRRTFDDYWRTPGYLYSKLAVSFGIALVNGISFYNTPLDIQGLTNSLFSMFLVTQQFSTISQQIIPRFINGRSLFEARERRDGSYSWVVFVASNLLVESFWQTLASVLVFTSWYFPTGIWRNGDQDFGAAERGAITFVLIWLFCLWNSTLSQALAAGIEHAETAVQIGTLLFWLSLVFCGIIVPPDALPRFWIFMYRVSPQTYLMNGLVLAGLKNTKVTCSPLEMLHFDSLPPNYDSCGAYLAEYAISHNGYVINPTAAVDCQYCPISETNVFLRSLGMGTDYPWRYVGLMVVYVLFNVLITFGFYKLARTRWRDQKKA